ncbi:ATP-dependent DNA helicase RecQ-like [Mya arenaria]|uniref:ATP-dependent DNA helicase RecQ-like n=1 Tax=Mya arenaria TaxID=6604 RepID=UPI0022E57062|nr:ATP-dependent DNA helicase RecQ-like [Mya arenaria]
MVQECQKLGDSAICLSAESDLGPVKDGKANIELIVLKRPSATARGNCASTPYDYIFERVLHELNDLGSQFPITVIYCKSMQWIGYGYQLAREILNNKFYVCDQIPENARLKQMILDSLQKPPEHCSIRLVFASVALGMGADLQHVKRVIHAGPPSSLETYVQEIGRCGRDGAHANAILYYNNSDLGFIKIVPKLWLLGVLAS